MAVAAVNDQRRYVRFSTFLAALIVIGILAQMGWLPATVFGLERRTLSLIAAIATPIFMVFVIRYWMVIRPRVMHFVRRHGGTVIQIGRLTYYRRRRIMTSDAGHKLTDDEFFDFLVRPRHNSSRGEV